MTFGILNHSDSLREIEIAMKAEAQKPRHLGMNDLVRRSTLAETKIHRSQEPFAYAYPYLLEIYAKFLADSSMPKNPHPNQLFSIKGACFSKKKVLSTIIKGFGQVFCALLSFTG